MFNMFYYCGEHVQKLLVLCGEAVGFSPSLFFQQISVGKSQALCPSLSKFCTQLLHIQNLFFTSVICELSALYTAPIINPTK